MKRKEIEPLRIPQLADMKKAGEKITMLTAYDYSMAKIADEAGIEILLVGDSLGMVVLGYQDTLAVTMEEMLHHTKAVVRGTKRAIVVADMPFLSYKVDVVDSVYNAGRFIKEAGAHAVKIEGGEVCKTVEAMLQADIPVMGHIGLTPQAIHKMGGYKVAGRTSEAAKKLKNDALSLALAGAFAVVLECLPYELAREISETIPIPTIGIGAGPYCDGQVLVLHDMLGLYDQIRPKFVKTYMNGYEMIFKAIKKFSREVKREKFPALEHSYK